MKHHRRLNSGSSQRGSFIIESMVSLIIFAISIIGLVGLAAQSMNQVGQSRSRNEASFLAGELISEMWVSGTTPAAFNSAAWVTRVQNTLPGGGATVTVAGNQVNITVTWTDAKNGGVGHQYVTSAQISNN